MTAARNRRLPRDSKLLVVDACVVCAASEADEPVSSAYRETLEQILKICHRVNLTSDIRVEWEEHMSRYSRRWYVAMCKKRKIIRDLPSAYWNPNKAKELTVDERQRIAKDAHLIQAALAADKIIYTNETKLVNLCRRKANDLQLPAPVRWCVPTEPGDRVEKL